MSRKGNSYIGGHTIVQTYDPKFVSYKSDRTIGGASKKQPRPAITSKDEQRIAQLRRDLKAHDKKVYSAVRDYEQLRQNLIALVKKCNLPQDRYPELQEIILMRESSHDDRLA